MHTPSHTHACMQAQHGQNEISRERSDKIYVRPKYQTDEAAEINLAYPKREKLVNFISQKLKLAALKHSLPRMRKR